MLSLQAASCYVSSRKQKYKALLASGWALPSENSSIVTNEFLNEVREGKVYCLKMDQLRLKACLDPPTIEMLIVTLSTGFTTNLHIFETD